MGIGLTTDHRDLAASARRFAERRISPRTADHREFWDDLAAQGVLGLHVPEEHGGQGFGTPELAVVLEVLGERCAPGPFLPTVIASALIAGSGTEALRAELLPRLADGSLTAAVALPETSQEGLALGEPDAGVVIVPVDGRWAVLRSADVAIQAATGLDLTRGLVHVSAGGAAGEDRVLPDVTSATVRDVIAVLAGAEACGVAAWAVSTAAEYARTRVQFGRPIGQFQGVKHRCAAMLVALEQARAAVWDAARAIEDGHGTRIAAAGAAVVAPDAAVRCAADAIQVLGGIGYTFEHDAHLYYRRALSLRALVGDPGVWAGQVTRLAMAGVRRELEPDLPDEALPLRERIHAEAARLGALDPAERRAGFASGGWMMPHLPEPWGRAASPLEQVIIQQEFRHLGRPNLGIAAWAVPSIVRYGTREQQEQFLPGTLRGEFVWCQLFSEPGAGSDLASLSTKAVRAEGGWLISGQKIWTSLAQYAHWAICLARTDPDAPKHEGITYFLVDMSSPGVEVRPLKEINGDEIFNQVFLDDVFVPDSLVVGEPGQGWRVARDTLSHERVSLGDSWGPGSQHGDMAGHLAKAGPLRESQLEEAGRLYAEGHAISALGLRVTLARLEGTDSGAASSVRKLLGMGQAQRVSEFCWSLDPADPHWSRMILTTRAFTIGGGTTEVQLNIIGERALGLPRDP
ncbi:acyl-CoA dehydrogenase [Planotetraspora phitsanulokensis]|uniref:Putative acyl-CoA dehydrogenase FadE n=1 Tax=Planotetraspora phitsanulokensis TaxID=575192 RepID=A0A8J3U535_9ACTN|nr:acyl-CoA dehydrogenase [Planotetraspora phitsanulokensis]GII38380.1 putative acyl-CoA dehydrogenase FadE [Planotetraspora phitsanulokensis]